MSEMVERVAKAIFDCCPEMTDGEFDDYGSLVQERYRDKARAAIKAMREPTKHMLMASGFGQTQRDKYRAMIDEALK